MDASEFVWPDEVLKIEYYGDLEQYVVHYDEPSSTPVRRVVEAANLLDAVRDLLRDDEVWEAYVNPVDETESVANQVTNDVLANELNSLRLEVDALRARVAVLEGRSWQQPYQPYTPNTPWVQPWTVSYAEDTGEVIYKRSSDVE